MVENEVDYVRNPLAEEEESVSFLTPDLKISPKAAPGANRLRIKESLMKTITAKKLQEHAKRVQSHRIDNEEDDDEEEEFVDDEEEDEEDNDEELVTEDEEEGADLEDLLSTSTGKKKKKRKKSKFVDEEAEDEDDDDEDDDEDDDDTDSETSEDEEDTEAESKDKDDLISVATSDESNSKVAELSTPVKNGGNDSNLVDDCGADVTPKVTTAVLQHNVSFFQKKNS